MTIKKYTSSDNLNQVLTAVKAYCDSHASSPIGSSEYRFRGFIATKDDLDNLEDNQDKDIVIALSDDSMDEQSSIYVYETNQWEYKTALEIANRNFTTNPITLSELGETVTAVLDGLQTTSLTEQEINQILYETDYIDGFTVAVNVGTTSGEVTAVIHTVAGYTAWFKFTLTGSVGLERIQTETTAGGNYPYAGVSLYDSEKNLLQSGTGGQIERGLSEGTYFVSILNYGSGGSIATPPIEGDLKLNIFPK